MTYCCALRLEQGMVFISDTRTNAGEQKACAYAMASSSLAKGK